MMPLKHKLTACFVALSLIIILLLSTLSYQALRDATLQRLNGELVTAANAVQKIIGPHTHDQLHNTTPENYAEISAYLAEFTSASKLDWVYSTVMVNGQINYTYINQTPEEMHSGRYESWYMEEYKIVPKMLHVAFSTGQVQYEDYQGEYGRYRSIFLPFYNQQGKQYVIGVDISLTDIDAILNLALTHTVLAGLFVMILVLVIERLIASSYRLPVNRPSKEYRQQR
ncbi:hypothetical protein [Photobacterium nomapromontoriensis]|uniref:hypothetical protein n=1 Tax=Photobacterium nomapromontoriensis TaxID=2910237 RepID=UPI003D14F952